MKKKRKKHSNPPTVEFPLGVTVLPGPLRLHGDVRIEGARTHIAKWNTISDQTTWTISVHRKRKHAWIAARRYQERGWHVLVSPCGGRYWQMQANNRALVQRRGGVG